MGFQNINVRENKQTKTKNYFMFCILQEIEDFQLSEPKVKKVFLSNILKTKRKKFGKRKMKILKSLLKMKHMMTNFKKEF